MATSMRLGFAPVSCMHPLAATFQGLSDLASERVNRPSDQDEHLLGGPSIGTSSHQIGEFTPIQAQAASGVEMSSDPPQRPDFAAFQA